MHLKLKKSFWLLEIEWIYLFCCSPNIGIFFGGHPLNQYKQQILINLRHFIIMISKQLRAAKQLISLEQFFIFKKAKFFFTAQSNRKKLAMKQCFKAIYACQYIKMISLPRITPLSLPLLMQTQMQVQLQDLKEEQAKKKISQIIKSTLTVVSKSNSKKLQGAVQTKQGERSKENKILDDESYKIIINRDEQSKQILKKQLHSILDNILRCSIETPALSQLDAQNVVDSFLKESGSLFQSKQQIRELMEKVLRFDPKLVMNKLEIEELEKIALSDQQKEARAKQKLRNFLSGILKYETTSLSQFQVESIMQSYLRENQTVIQPKKKLKRLLNNILKFNGKSFISQIFVKELPADPSYTKSQQRVDTFISQVFKRNPLPLMSIEESSEIAELFLKQYGQFIISDEGRQKLRKLFIQLLNLDVRSIMVESQIMEFEKIILSDKQKREKAMQKLQMFWNKIVRYDVEVTQDQCDITNAINFFLIDQQQSKISKQQLKNILNSLSKLQSVLYQPHINDIKFKANLKNLQKEKQKSKNFLAGLLELNSISVLDKSDISDISKRIAQMSQIQGKQLKQLDQLLRNISSLDVKKVLKSLQIKEFPSIDQTEEQKRQKVKQKLEKLLIQILKFDGSFALKEPQVDDVVQSVHMRLQQRKQLSSELIKFDVRSILEEADLFEVTDESILKMAKQQMQAYFNKGIQMSTLIFNQERFMQAQNESLQSDNIIIFRFYPTFVLTGQIFSIMNNNKKIQLVYGQKGVSKSISFILRVLLQNEISTYLIQHRDQSLAYLNKYITYKQKIFYWNISPINNINFQVISSYADSVIQSLKLQCFEDLDQKTKDEINRKISNYKNGMQVIEQSMEAQQIKIQKAITKSYQCIFSINSLIKNFYRRRGLILRVVIDQINSLLSHIRKANDIYYQNFAKFRQNENWIQESNIVSLISKILDCFVRLSTEDVFYNSSINIEQHFMNKPSNKSGLLHLELYGRQLNKIRVEFQQEYLKDFRDFEMSNFLAFEINRLNLKKQTKWDNESIVLFRKYLWQVQSSSITPLQIRTMLSDLRASNKFLNYNNEEKCRMLVNGLTKEQERLLSYVSFVDKLKTQLYEINMRLLFVFFVRAKNRNNKKELLVQVKQMFKQKSFERGEQKYKFQLKLEQVRSSLDKNNFEMLEEGGSYYVRALFFNYTDIVMILGHLSKLNKQKNQFLLKNRFGWLLQQTFSTIGVKSIKGQFFQSLLLAALAYQQTSFKIQYRDSQNKKQIKQFNIDLICPFPTIHKDNKQESLQNLMNEFTLEQSLKQDGLIRTKILIPTVKKAVQKFRQSCQGIVSEKSTNSIASDFVIIQKAQIQNSKSKKIPINVNFFQVTTQKQNIQNKIDGAINNIKSIINKNQKQNQRFQVKQFYFYLIQFEGGRRQSKETSIELIDGKQLHVRQTIIEQCIISQKQNQQNMFVTYLQVFIDKLKKNFGKKQLEIQEVEKKSREIVDQRAGSRKKKKKHQS